ncbi:carph-isopro domain-containing protein [Sphingobium yanoikuyae]|uniref:carph-isopro domain-containing protein n=1 Tax=Sphingobium yanoikuyae TaxID=13690 RepID=UPI002FD890F0
MTDHREIIRQLGGIRGLARKLRHRNHTTVQGWWERGNIPADRLGEVLAAAVLPSEQSKDAA